MNNNIETIMEAIKGRRYSGTPATYEAFDALVAEIRTLNEQLREWQTRSNEHAENSADATTQILELETDRTRLRQTQLILASLANAKGPLVKSQNGSGSGKGRYPEGTTAEEIKGDLLYLLLDVSVDLGVRDLVDRDALAAEIDAGNTPATETSPLRKFTVIGLWDDNGQVFSATADAAGPHEAIEIVAQEDDSDNLQILGAVEGEIAITCACEDTGKAAYTVDLFDLDDSEGKENTEEPAQEQDGQSRRHILTGSEAIVFAKENMLELSMRSTLGGKAWDGLSIEEAQRIAENDPGRVFIVVPTELYPGLNAKQSGSAVPPRKESPASTKKRTKRSGIAPG